MIPSAIRAYLQRKLGKLSSAQVVNDSTALVLVYREGVRKIEFFEDGFSYQPDVGSPGRTVRYYEIVKIESTEPSQVVQGMTVPQMTVLLRNGSTVKVVIEACRNGRFYDLYDVSTALLNVVPR